MHASAFCSHVFSPFHRQFPRNLYWETALVSYLLDTTRGMADLNGAILSAFSGDTHHTHTERAAFHRYRCPFYDHLPRRALAHNDQQALYSPASSLQRLNFVFSATSQASRLHQRTRRKDRPSANFPNRE